jgi:glycosyltransferase involved in cell wall biosynthesis
MFSPWLDSRWIWMSAMNRPERIAFDARYINDRYHGIGRYAFRLLEALVFEAREQAACGALERTFVVFRGPEGESRFDWSALAGQPNVELRQGPWPLYWPQEQLLWPWFLRRERIDLFHTPYFVAPLLAPCPLVVTVHDLIFDRYPQYMPSAWSRPYYRLLMAASLRRAKKVIAVSQATAADLARYYGTPASKTIVILEGSEPGLGVTVDRGRIEALRQRYNLARPFLLSVGVRRPHKNLARLVQAFALLAHDVEHDLVFAGPVDERFPDTARRAALDAGLDGRVRFLGWVSEEDLAALYALADLVVVPSLVEGFGLPVLEAMASGTAVVAANVSSLPEVAGQAGVLVDPYDEAAMAETLRSLLADGNQRQFLSEAGRAQAARFTWQKTAGQVWQVYEDVRQ